MLKENNQLLSHGFITELFSFFVSSLLLISYDAEENVKLLSMGHFSINLILKAHCPIFATVCFVEDFQWPLAKDTIVLRMGKNTFAINLPGLLYGLQFPNFCSEEHINTLKEVFRKFCSYSDINDNLGYHQLEDNEPNFWNKLRHYIEPSLMQLGQFPGLSSFRILDQNSCFIRASRMSATTKFVTDIMVHSGTLTRAHINISGTNPPSVLHQDLAYASTSVFSDFVDVIELDGGVSSNYDYVVKNVETVISASHHDIGFKVWNLNKVGILGFIHSLSVFVEKEEKFLKEKDQKWEEIAASKSVNDKEIKEAETSTKSKKDNGKGILIEH
ncbi:hypothetical protein Lal_00010872 [Lupinus albus]|nr:hypothetical protein Lal_00010872 [Lupinus albus]